MKHLSLLLFVALVGLPSVLSAQPIIEGTLGEGAMSATHIYKVERSGLIEISTINSDFDTVLRVTSSRGSVQESDDAAGMANGAEVDSRVRMTAEVGDELTITVTPYSDFLSGPSAYQIHIALRNYDIQTIEGRLVPSDERALKGEYYDLHTVEVGLTSSVTFEMLAYGLDGFLVVESPSGIRQSNDDSGDGTSRVEIMMPEPGTWKIYATSYSPDEVGAYDLRILTESAVD